MIQLYAQSLGQQERFKHRAWIGVRVEALLDGYWQTRPSDAVKDEILRDWIDALENFTPDEIRAACRSYMNGADRARKPKPGDIRAVVLSSRAAVVKAQPAPVKALPAPTSAEMADEMKRRAAFAKEVMSKAFGGK